MTYAPNEDELRAAYEEQERLRADLATARRDLDLARGLIAELERERDEARNAMHRREEEVVAARCERDEARAKLTECHRLAWPRGGDLNGDPVCDLMLAFGTMQCTTRDALAERDEARARVAELEREVKFREAQTQRMMLARDAMQRERDYARAEVAEVARVMNGDHSTPMRAFAYEVSAVVKSHATLLKQRDEALDRAERAEAQVATLREALDELADIVQGHLDDGDKLDSFTLRPARAALAATEPKGVGGCSNRGECCSEFDATCPRAMTAPDRTARLVAALKGIRAKLESESPEFDDYSPIDDLDAALKEFEP